MTGTTQPGYDAGYARGASLARAGRPLPLDTVTEPGPRALGTLAGYDDTLTVLGATR